MRRAPSADMIDLYPTSLQPSPSIPLPSRAREAVIPFSLAGRRARDEGRTSFREHITRFPIPHSSTGYHKPAFILAVRRERTLRHLPAVQWFAGASVSPARPAPRCPSLQGQVTGGMERAL